METVATIEAARDLAGDKDVPDDVRDAAHSLLKTAFTKAEARLGDSLGKLPSFPGG